MREALATVEAARQLVLATTGSVLLARADELEASLRLRSGTCALPPNCGGLRADRRALLLARIALAVGDSIPPKNTCSPRRWATLRPRRALMRQILLAAAAIGRDDPMAASIIGSAIQTARHGGFLNTVVTAAPLVTSYLITSVTQAHTDAFLERLIAAALEVRAAQPDTARSYHALIEPLTTAELRILKLLPTSTYPQIAATLYISRNTVKTHLRSVYQKLGVASRSEAIGRAADLRLL